MARKRNKILTLILKVSISSSLMYLVLKKAGPGEVYHTIRAMNPLMFLGASVLYLLTLYLSTLRWRSFLPEGTPGSAPATSRLFSLYLMGAFFNHILPGLVGGDALRIYYLYKDTRSSASSLASVFADRYTGFAALLFLGLAALPFGIGRIRGTGAEWAVPVIALAFVVFSLLVFTLRLGDRFATVKGFYEYFLRFRRRPAVLLRAFLLSIAVQVLVILSVYVISLGLGAGASPLEFFLFLPIIIVLTTIPVSISGLGIREGAFTLLFGLTGVSPEMATSISLAWFLSFLAGSTPGIVVYLRWKVRDEVEGYTLPS